MTWLGRLILALIHDAEPAGHRNAAFPSHRYQQSPPARRYPAALPLVHGAARDRDAPCAECLYNHVCVAERFDEFGVAHGVPINRTRCDMSSPFEIANESDAPEPANCNPRDMARKRDPENISSGERLAATRLFLYPKLTQWQFAEQWGVNRTTYNNWEIGKAPVPKEFIDRFRRSHPKYGYGWFWHAEVPDDAEFRNFLADKGLVSFKH